jgi:PAS domain-containing protein
MMSGDAYEIIERLRRFDGIYRWFQVRGLPFRGSSGRIVRWYVLLTDIDDLKRAEEALHESVRESRLIVDSIPGLVVALAPDGEVEFVNRQGLEFFGQPLEELKHWGTNGAIHPEDLPRLIEDFTRAIASGLPFRVGSTWSTFRRRLPLVSVSRISASGRQRAHRSLVQPPCRR